MNYRASCIVDMQYINVVVQQRLKESVRLTDGRGEKRDVVFGIAWEYSIDVVRGSGCFMDSQGALEYQLAQVNQTHVSTGEPGASKKRVS